MVIGLKKYRVYLKLILLTTNLKVVKDYFKLFTACATVNIQTQEVGKLRGFWRMLPAISGEL